MKQHFERFNLTQEALEIIEDNLRQLDLEPHEKEAVGIRLSFIEEEDSINIEFGIKTEEEIPIVFERGFFTKVTFFVNENTFNYMNENNCILDFQDTKFSFINLEKEFFDEPERDTKDTKEAEVTNINTDSKEVQA